MKTIFFLKKQVRPSEVSVPASSIQAGPFCNTSWPCFSCASSAGAQRTVGNHGIDNAEFALITLQVSAYFYYIFILLSVCNDVSQQNDPLRVPQRGREEVSASFCPKRSWAGCYVDSWGRSSVGDPGNTHSPGSIPHGGRWNLLWAWKKETDTRKEINCTCKTQSRKYIQKQPVTKYQWSTCVLTQQLVDAS